MFNSAEPHLMQVLITHKNKLLWLLLAAATTQAYTCRVTYKELPLWQKYGQAYLHKRRQHKLLKDGTNQPFSFRNNETANLALFVFIFYVKS